MKLLFARALRGLLPVALGLAGVHALLLAALALGPVLFDSPALHAADLAFGLAVMACPFVLAAAAFARDYETGGEAFLATLPARRLPLLAARLAAAALASGLTVLVVWALCRLGESVFLGPAPRLLSERGEVLVGLASLGGFAAGVAGGVLARRTVAGLLVGPALVGGVAWLLLALTDFLGAPEPWPEGLSLAGGALVFLGAAAAYVRRGAWPAPTPARALGAGATALALLLPAAGAGLAFAADHTVFAEREVLAVSSSTTARTALLASFPHNRWRGPGGELPRHELWVFTADAPDTPWSLPASASCFNISPDGRHVLLGVPVGAGTRFALADVGERRLAWGPAGAFSEQLSTARAERQVDLLFESVPFWRCFPSSPQVWAQTPGRGSMSYPVVWAERNAFLVDPRTGRLVRWDGAPGPRLPTDTALEDYQAGALLLRDPAGQRYRFEVRSGRTTPLPIPVRALAARLGPAGRRVLWLEPTNEGGLALWCQDDPGQPPRPLGPELPTTGPRTAPAVALEESWLGLAFAAGSDEALLVYLRPEDAGVRNALVWWIDFRGTCRSVDWEPWVTDYAPRVLDWLLPGEGGELWTPLGRIRPTSKGNRRARLAIWKNERPQERQYYHLGDLLLRLPDARLLTTAGYFDPRSNRVVAPPPF
ncbi:MAG: hypothetical protein D6731_17600 [Planctomycetota bacterium]|nr:MAG: hypothetical protein D6731_17600 [Planctomycetota bacterium]